MKTIKRFKKEYPKLMKKNESVRFYNQVGYQDTHFESMKWCN